MYFRLRVYDLCRVVVRCLFAVCSFTSMVMRAERSISKYQFESKRISLRRSNTIEKMAFDCCGMFPRLFLAQTLFSPTMQIPCLVDSLNNLFRFRGQIGFSQANREMFDWKRVRCLNNRRVCLNVNRPRHAEFFRRESLESNVTLEREVKETVHTSTENPRGRHNTARL